MEDKKTLEQQRFVEGVENLALLNIEIFKQKNKNYGNSFYDSMKEYGYLPLIIRIKEKLNRLDQLTVLNESERAAGTDESILDTLLDISNYCLMGAEYYNEEIKLK